MRLGIKQGYQIYLYKSTHNFVSPIIAKSHKEIVSKLLETKYGKYVDIQVRYYNNAIKMSAILGPKDNPVFDRKESPRMQWTVYLSEKEYPYTSPRINSYYYPLYRLSKMPSLL